MTPVLSRGRGHWSYSCEILSEQGLSELRPKPSYEAVNSDGSLPTHDRAVFAKDASGLKHSSVSGQAPAKEETGCLKACGAWQTSGQACPDAFAISVLIESTGS